MKARIVERIAPDGSKTYVLQKRIGLFRWFWWVDIRSYSMGGDACSVSYPTSMDGDACSVSYSTLEEAQRNLRRFDGTPLKPNKE